MRGAGASVVEEVHDDLGGGELINRQRLADVGGHLDRKRRLGAEGRGAGGGAGDGGGGRDLFDGVHKAGGGAGREQRVGPVVDGEERVDAAGQLGAAGGREGRGGDGAGGIQ